MATFLDVNGVERTIQLNPISVQRINEKFNIDLLGIVHGDLASRLSEQLPALLNIIGDLAFPDIEEQEAAELLADEIVLQKAVSAFLKAVVGFLPNSAILKLCDDEQLVSELISITA